MGNTNRTSARSAQKASGLPEDRARGKGKQHRAPLPPSVDRLIDALVTRLLIDIRAADGEEEEIADRR